MRVEDSCDWDQRFDYLQAARPFSALRPNAALQVCYAAGGQCACEWWSASVIIRQVYPLRAAYIAADRLRAGRSRKSRLRTVRSHGPAEAGANYTYPFGH